MLSNYELYGTENVPPVPKVIANERVDILRHHLAELCDAPFMEQNNHIQTEVLRAISFWQKLSNQEDTGL